MNTLWQLKSWMITLLVTLVVGVFWFWPQPLDLSVSAGEVTSLNEGWLTDRGNLVTLPVNLEHSAFTQHSMSRTLPPRFDQNQMILIRGSLQSVSVALNDEVIYDVSFRERDTLYASAWHLVEVPANSAGQTITITFESPYEAMSGRLNPIVYGSTASIHGHLIGLHAHRLLVGFFILFLGTFIVILSFVTPLIRERGYLYIGLFLAAMSFWILGESRMLQYVTGSPLVIGSISYLSLLLIPIPMALYINHYVMRKPLLIFYLLLGIYIINAILIVTLQVLDIADFFETVIMTQAFIFIGMMTAFAAIFYERFILKVESSNDFLHALALIFIFSILEFSVFLLGDFTITSRFLLLGIIILAIFVSINLIEYLVDRIKSGYQRDLFQKLAYTDMLTSTKTRLAFQEDLASHLESEIETPLRLVYFDFNDLKTINDTYGHLTGDQALIKGVECMNASFGVHGTLYRLGGDEFACIIRENIPAYEPLLEQFHQQLKTYNRSSAYKIEVAVGYTDYIPGQDRTPEHLMKRADGLMYENKKQRKQAV